MGKARASGSGLGDEKDRGPSAKLGGTQVWRKRRPGFAPFEGGVASLQQTSQRQGPLGGAQGAPSRELAGWPRDTGGPGRRQVPVAGPTGGKATGGCGTVQRSWL